MTAGLQTIIYPVKDLDAAKALFGALLGVEPYADEPYYVGYKAAGQDVGLDPNGHAKGMTGPVPYWHVTDLRQRLAALLEAGAQLLQDAQDVGGGRLIASVRDTDGNLVGLLQDPAA
ncbi:glyoxalase [Streptomyces sp. SID486]|jgi:predicted enzyme related to lactoylglutathione lyase|uniref:VOC family protein n=1 Tax=unclassified Streptomyces TaxID=2593676 RepID=UPI0013704763|nr:MULTISPECIES: VOC family protein [unclassified Streptomyces]MYW21997.1 glyoxalase [Streptomyces sp. SID2955]MYW42023.1 glyoxalase [Streptomyces sp. SID161]MYX95089.1 glyoxalase [Streptomyces sp. SID486]